MQEDHQRGSKAKEKGPKKTKYKKEKKKDRPKKQFFFQGVQQGKGRPREVKGDTGRCRKTTNGSAKQKKKDQKKHTIGQAASLEGQEIDK